MRKLLFVIMVLVLVSGLIFSGCAKETTTSATTPAATTPAATTPKPTTPAATTTPAPTTVTPKTGGTLKYAESMFPGSNLGWVGDPGWLTASPSACVFLETIMAVDAKGNIMPYLATKWDVSDDLKTITITLRQGIKFHDGSDWNATVAKWNLDYLIKGKQGDFVSAHHG